MSLHDAASLDWGDKSEAAEGAHISDPSQLYLSPVFKVPTYTAVTDNLVWTHAQLQPSVSTLSTCTLQHQGCLRLSFFPLLCCTEP